MLSASAHPEPVEGLLRLNMAYAHQWFDWSDILRLSTSVGAHHERRSGVGLPEPAHAMEEAAQVGYLAAVGHCVPNHLTHTHRNGSGLRYVTQNDLPF